MAQRKNEAKWVESRARWQINVTNDDGKRKTFASSKPGRKGKLEAERKADEWLEAGDRKNVRLGDAWAGFIASKKETCGTPWVNKLTSIGRVWLLPGLQTKRISRITQQDWQNCINAAYKAGKSKKTLENIRGAITAFYVYCDMNRIDMEEPKRLKIPSGAPVGEREILQTDDIKTLFTVDTVKRYGRDEQAFYIHAWRLIVLLGLRRGELAGLKHSDIKDGVLSIQRAINSLGEETRGKTIHAVRRILLPARAHKILADQAAMLKQRGIATRTWIFPGEDGNAMDTNSLYKHWRAYREQNGIKANLHELRHTTVSLIKAELPEDLLKQLVGHAKSMDTDRYKHPVDGDMERTAKVIDGVFDRLV